MNDIQLYPLTNAQQRIWYTELLYPDTSVSQLSGTVKLVGKLDIAAFMQATNMIVEQYDSFRIRITSVDGVPQQYVVPYEEKQFECLDLSSFEHISHMEAWLDQHKRKPLQLLDSELFQFLFLKISEEEYWFNVKVHHIISDGISMVLFGNQQTEYYIELVKGNKPAVLGDSSYIDYIAAEQSYELSDRYRKDKAYWMDKFADLPELTGWKTYNPLSLSTAAVREHFTVSEDLYAEVKLFCQENRISLFQFFMGAMYIYMYKVTNQPDVVIGTSLANRGTKKEKQTVGMFVSTAAARANVDKHMDLLSFLQGVAKDQMSILRHQKYPYNQLIQNLRETHRNKDIQRLFGVSLEYRPMSWVDMDGVRILTDYDFCEDEVNDIVLHIVEMLDDNELVLHVDYRTELFERSEVADMVAQLLTIAGQIIHTPHRSIADVTLLSEAEEQAILSLSAGTATGYPREKTIHGLFEEQAMRTPDSVAVQLDEQYITYQALNEQANRLARYLRTEGIGADTLVGIMADRSVEMVVGILAILKAGGAYVPVDPEYPEERIRYMLEDSGVRLLLTQSHLQEHVTFGGKVVDLAAASYEGDSSNLESVSGPEHLAYVIYTSGTTGKPKGTLIEHKNVVRLLFNDHNLFDFGPQDTWTLFHSFCFDFSVWEMYGALLNGGRLVIVPPLTAKSPEAFLALLKECSVTILNQTPTYFYQLLQEELGQPSTDLSLRKVIFGGEALSPSLLKDWRVKYPHVQLINMYGITETTVHVTYKEITEIEIAAGKSNIGTTIPTLSAYILDDQCRLQPIGVPGELYIAGDGLARGYLNRPELTAEKFVEHPFQSGERMYRTGDLARWLPDGNIEYLGRIDHQVKIRGYRIELGEVEAQILKAPHVRETIVLARDDEQGQKMLCAYYVASDDLTPGELRGLLTGELPAYMIPSYFVRLEQMPLTSNGKLDRRSLPAPEGSVQSGEAYVAPRTVQETQLALIWQDILGVARVGIRDNFFEIGGHSLRATLLASRIHKELNCSVSLREVFQLPTVEALAQLVSDRTPVIYQSIPQADENEAYPVSSAQKRLYVLSQMEGGELSYNMPGAFMVDGSLDRDRLESAFSELIRRHESLRTSFYIKDGEPVQRVHEDVQFAVEYAEAMEEDIASLCTSFVRVFDLSQAPLLRVGLVKLQEDRHLLLFDMHHIVSDGVSITILVDEFTRLYQGENLPALRIQYKDYAVWQRKELGSKRLQELENYWLGTFEGELPLLDLPLDFPRPTVRSFAGSRIDFTVGESGSKALQELASRTGTTLYMVLMAAYSVLLHKYTGQEDIIVGSPVAGRPHADVEGTMGMFVNTLALRSHPAGEKTFQDYLQEVKETALQAFEHQDYPFEVLVEKLEIGRDVSRNPLFDTLLVLQNTEQGEHEIDGLHFTSYPLEQTVAKFDLSLNVAEQGAELAFEFEYAAVLYERESVERLASHLLRILDAVAANPRLKLAEIEMITPEEKAQIVEEFNATSAPYPSGKTIHELFGEQVKRTPDGTALVCGNVRLTYRELEERAGLLAQTLCSLRMTSEQPVAIIGGRSIEMVVGMLAVLRAGGAYVPIDPEYPEERIRYMLEDSGAKLLLVQKSELVTTDYGIPIVDLSKEETYTTRHVLPEITGGPRGLAYIMYTSGTTGKPKGVMVEHRGVVRLVKETNYAELNESTRILQTGAVAFDASTFEVWGALLNGGQLYFVENDVILVGEKLKEAIASYGITTLWLTSPLFYQLSQQDDQLFGDLKMLLVGGDVLSVPNVNRVMDSHPGLTILNCYGPTENTTFSTGYPITERPEGSVPIGRPIRNSTAYVVDSSFRLKPVGAWGELIVGGDGVARGYLNRPDLTAEKFISSPVQEGERCYRTGDLVRWRADGTLEYKGRMDEQVKIRGYRIELPEVEAQLAQMESIREAVVVVREDEFGQKQLCAYYVADRALTAGEVRLVMAQALPSYMIPSHFVQLERMPLMANGKVDRRALPTPQAGANTGRTYTAPRTSAEEALASVWQGVLGVAQVGIHDNFFELGGDSIKAIQVSSRLLQAGYRLEMKELFKSPTVAELGGQIQPAGRMAKQEAVSGEASLTPVQRWFLERQQADPHHFNQAVMLYREQGFEEEALHQVMTKLAEHHDALRLVFRQTEHGYEAWNRSLGEGELYNLLTADLRDQVDPGSSINQLSDEIQRSIDLAKGPLLRLGLFHCQDGDHLLIVIHHLAVDGVSWRILFEDIAAGYEQAIRGETVAFPQKTDSFLYWGEALSRYAESLEMEPQRAYWQELEGQQIEPLPKDETSAILLLQDSEAITAQWTAEETELLLKKAHRAYQTETNDLLLAALGLAVAKWSGNHRIAVNLEGHGREPIIPDMDITRTVGWFTSQYPVILDLEDSLETASLIKRVKEGLRRIPNKGIGYGLLKHMASSADTDRMGRGLHPEISFNYLGQFDQDLQESALQVSPYPTGNAQSYMAEPAYTLDINGMISDGALSLTITYNGKQYRSSTIEQLAAYMEESLREVLHHCVTRERPGLTPSDVLAKGLTTTDLEELSEYTSHIGEIENVYSLTPMQKGMLFHYLLEPNTGAYFEQAAFDIQGSFDPESFGRSLDALVGRHAILRTNFYSGWGDDPLQVVFRNRSAEWVYEDLRRMDESQREAYLETFAANNTNRGFDLSEDGLLRVSILRTGEEDFRLLWSFHHIVMDGWCIPLITQEVFEYYFALLEGREPKLAEVLPYSRYIEWLDKQDETAAADYWSTYLTGYEQQTLLPQSREAGKPDGYVSEKLTGNLGSELTGRLEQIAKEAHVTVNTLFQSIWGIALQRYNGSRDVVYGSVVSGRPAEISGIERMIGLFINTIPVRVKTEERQSFSALLKQQQEQYLASHAYSTYPLFEIQAQTNQKQDLITHLLVFENYPVEEEVERLDESHTAFEIKDAELVEQTNYDFNLIVLPGQELKLLFQYNALVYNRADIERISGHLIHLLEQIAANPGISVDALELITPQEREQILNVWGDVPAEFPHHATSHGLFEAQVARTPDAPAVLFDDQIVTYTELNARANGLARTLRSKGVKPGDLVGLLADRSIEMIVGVYGIMKAGGAYVPMDPEYPQGRIDYMLEDSGVTLLITQDHLRGRTGWNGNILSLDDATAYEAGLSNLEQVASPEDLACMIYTSDTTGLPKGVLVEHHGLCNTAQAYRDVLEIAEQDRVVQFTSLSYDAAAAEILMTLSYGAALCIPTTQVISDYFLFEEFMNEKAITVALLPSAYANYLDPKRLLTLDRLLTSGSAVSAGSIRKWEKRVRYFHAYGLTEDSICTTIWSAPDSGEALEAGTIGRPIANHRVYIVDDHLRLQPVGVAGELCVSGAGLARGYHNRPALNIDKFVENPFAPGERLYRTGDLARWLPDGTIEYVGRLDDQVNIRGYRMEPGEVEVQLLNVPSVQEVAVIAMEGVSGQLDLCAYFVAEQELAESELRAALSDSLPGYMIPYCFVQLKQMPLTSEGTIDRKALPYASGGDSDSNVAPRTSAEIQLADIWHDILGVTSVGVKDNFFELGGHSLRAALLVSRIRKEMNREISLREVFESPTIEELAQIIESYTLLDFEEIPLAGVRESYSLSSAQKRLFILSQLEGGEISYNMPGVLMVEGVLDHERMEAAFYRLIQRHDALRTRFVTSNGEPVQQVLEEVPFALGYTALSEEEAQIYLRGFVRPFDLGEAPLLRADLIRIEQERHLLLFDMHHIVSDGVSINILVEEFIRFYQGEDLSPLRIQYTDYAVWQQEQLGSERLEAQEAYWLDAFRGSLPVLDLPGDEVRPAVRSFAGDCIDFRMDTSLSHPLQELAAKSGSTLFMVLLAAYTALLHKYTGQDDVIVGSPIAGRSHEDLQGLIGMFVGTLALRTYPEGSKSFEDYLEEVKETALRAYENQDYPFEELVEKLQLQRDLSRNPLFDTMFVLQNTEQGEQTMDGLSFTPYGHTHPAAKFDLTLTVTEVDDGLDCSLEYATAIYKRETAERMAGHFVQLVREAIANPAATLASIDIVTPQEKAKLMDEPGGMTADYPREKTIHGLFEDQAARTPEAVAVICEEATLTYKELNERSNGLARSLREQGLKPDGLVGIMADRSLEMVVGIFAILKAGGAYVPVDPEYPDERIRFMLEDSGTKLLLTQAHLRDRVSFAGDILALDEAASYQQEVSNLEPVVRPEHLAYVIYTSGTTGKPKGTLIEHRNVVRLLFNDRNLFDFGSEDTWTLFHSFCFDFSVWEMYGALLNGGRLVIVPPLTAKSPEQFLQLLKDRKVTILNQTPTYFYQLLQEELSHRAAELSLRMIIFGGEALSPALLKDWRVKYPQVKLVNMYGITETTVHVTYKEITETEIALGRSNIGTTIPTLRAYILDEQRRPQPVGIPGELYIAGIGLARGYLNRPELTNEKFVDHPFESGARMYRSGDLARWLPDGTIEYLGRIDHQVKIRGYRIELGEVEVKVLHALSVREAVVLAREDGTGQKVLAAYFTADGIITSGELRKALAAELPAYMIPSYFMQLEQMPLTPNGKLDRRSLPAPEANMQTGTAYAPPRTAAEVALVSVWQGVLGAQQVGIHDHFFDLGGDSIKAIQVSSRLFQAGYKLEMKDLFKYPTIAELAPYLKAAGRTAEQGEVRGAAELMPIQRWFFERHTAEPHHYNHAIMLYRKDGFDEKALRLTMNKIAIHHDALRMVFRSTGDGYVAWNRGTDEGELYTLDIADVQNEEDQAAAVQAKADEIQASFDLQDGTLLKLGLFHCSDGDHLLIVIHHLVVDGVSWRILFEDIAAGYEQALDGQEIVLPQKTDSYRLWSEQAAQYAAGAALEKERAYWMHVEEAVLAPLPKDMEQEPGTIRDNESVTVTWSAEETDMLLRQANRAYHTETNDLLLTALGMAVQRWTGMERLLVNLEGHGREMIVPELDITRTVGWFTTQYPVLLDLEVGQEVSAQIKRIKENLRGVPHKGIGYGLLKYMAPEGRAGYRVEPEISFNYLGQFDQDLDGNALSLSAHSVGNSLSDQTPQQYALDLNGMIAEGELSLTITYSSRQYRKETVSHLAGLLQSSLSEVIRHCAAQEHSQLTPSDVLFQGLTLQQLDQLTAQTAHLGEIEDVYKLTPMQKGMLFHSLLAPDSSSYFEQATFELRGSFDVDIFSESFQALARRHAILRTNFYDGIGDVPLQVVFKQRPIPLTYVDLRARTPEEQEAEIQAYTDEDLIKGFRLDEDPLMRVAVLQTDDSCRVLWSFHHIVMDGWCIPIITQELFEHYSALRQQVQPVLPPAQPYSRYIEWLDAQDHEEAATYWSQYLEGYDGHTVLPEGRTKSQGKEKGYVLEEHVLSLGTSLTRKMDLAAKRNQVTVNTLMQTAWGLILQRYNGSSDVVFGGVVSGRPAEIAGIENMVGLFINTVPIRVQSSEDEAFVDVMKRTQAQALAGRAYDTHPLYEIQGGTAQKQDLLSHIMIFENYPLDEQVEQSGNQDEENLEVANFTMFEQTNYDFNLVVIPGEDIKVCIRYNALVYEQESMERIGGHLSQMLEQIAVHPEAAVKDLDIVTSKERAKLLDIWGGTGAAYPSDQGLHTLFEEQVLRTPDKIAAINGDTRMTYRELNEQANRLASTLRVMGLRSEQVVGLLADRSLELLVAIMGVLKAGGAYVPIDPEYPQERIQYILKDSGAEILLTQSHLTELVSFEGTLLELDSPQIYGSETNNPDLPVTGTDLVYLIYTSGTTGNPKGTMINHKGIVNYIWWAKEVYCAGEPMDFPLYSSISFDLTLTSIFTPLICGGIVHIYEGIDKAEIVQHILRENVVDILKLTPTHLGLIKEMAIPADSRIQQLIVGGENLTTYLSKSITDLFGGQIKIYNEYGPTETVVGCMIHLYDPIKDTRESVPIGLPSDNVYIHILDEQLRLVPLGVAGEMYIAGDGVARGYLNRPELTSEKFIKNPYPPGGNMYRTGDLARRLPNGEIEYLGRIDHQVKIRGYRIELGEVEAKLLDLPLVEETIVVAWEDANGQKSLCAYFVAERDMSISELRNELAGELPGYMIPSYFVQLEAMPLTPNGKLDRKGLPAPSAGVKTGTTYTAPRTETENILASVWQGVLGVPSVGIHDNFFELGGDSIKSIQVSSRLLHAGYKLEMKDLFGYPTIAELAQRVRAVIRIADQGDVIGTVRLAPAQRWFFDKQSTALHHFNQSVMLYRREGFDTDALANVIQKIAVHHDALRLVFREGEQGFEAWNRGIGEGELYSLLIHDLRDEIDPTPAVEAGAEAIQRSISLGEGPLLRLGLFRCTDGDHLLIVIHHLAVDGVSWRILFEDLQEGYEQAARGEAVTLPQKTDSYRVWVEGLSQYANSPAAEHELKYWAGIEGEGFTLLPKDKDHSVLLVKDSKAVTVKWTREETNQFLKEAHRAYTTEANDLLLTALGMAVHEWTGIERVGVILEGHGREPIVPDIDITRTIGWFTSQYPIVLEMGETLETGARIKRVKEGLRRIPNKGVGYGILKYLSNVPNVSTSSVEPEITFNYLGQFDQDLAGGTLEVSSYLAGPEVSEQMVQHQALNINGLIAEGELQLSVSYNSRQFNKKTVEKFAGILKKRLREVIGHCVRKEGTELTSNDVLLKEITLDKIEELEERTRHIGSIENIYKLTPMQKGMLFHSLLEPGSEVYFEQAKFEIHGSFYPEDFERSLTYLMQRHAILRTNFYAGWGDLPVQIVFKERMCGFVYEDLRGLNSAEIQTYLDAYTAQDKEEGFDLAEGALLRVAILRTEEDMYHLLWSFHHIIMDGWCMPLVLQEVFETYGALREQRVPELPAAVPYSRYIQWLEEQGEEEASSYWRGYLEGYEQQTKLPQAMSQPSGKVEAYESESLVFTLEAELTQRLEQAAKQYQVTMNTLMQAAWGIVLQRYNGSQDVVFGSVVSGRPAEIPGIESMVGLFINTVPVRVQTQEKDTFANVMRRQQKAYLAGHAYDSYPLYEIQALSEQKQDLISHIMVFENYPVEEHLEEKVSSDEAEYKITDVQMFEQTNYDFNLIVLPGNRLQFLYRYNARVYDQESVERIQGHLMNILEGVSMNPAVRVDELELITAEEKSQIMDVWGDTAVSYPREQTIHGIFEEKAALTPERIALMYGATELTYGELDQKANRLARTLRAQGIGPDQPVGIMVERSLEMIIGIHAILKAGGAYVPIDPEFPEDRIRYMLEDSGAKLLLTKNHLRDRFPFAGTLLSLDDPQAYDTDGSGLEPSAGPEHLAYIIYTSGSTGRPKGVMIEHRSAVHTLSQLEAEYPMLADDRFLLKTTFTFDFSVPELFCWFFGQGTLVLLPQGADKDPMALLEAVEVNRITHLNLVPSMLSVLVQYLKETGAEGFRNLKYMFACGETLPAKLVEEYYKVSPQAVLENIYGPTEAAVYATRYTTSPETAALTHVPIGKPYANVQVWIMDSASHISPIGVPGELCIAGEGVARGYFNRPDLTAESFIPHPYKPGARIYRTGDLARWLPDGNLEYLGRIDHQVKIRGYRIELGEVESQILKVPSVQEAVVLALTDAGGNAQLCAYFVAEQALAANELRSLLAGGLPGYMIPSAFVQLSQMPLNPNGKLDRKALPAPESLLRSGAEHISPRTPVEMQVARIWTEVLGVQDIGIKDHFFELGGHSLKVLGLIQRIQSDLGVQLPLQTVFNRPTVEEMSYEVSRLRAEDGAGIEEMEILRFHSKGSHKVFCFPPRVGYSLGYYEMAKELEEQCEVYGFEFIGDRFQGQEMLDQYVDAIVSIQAEGPYTFLGYSLGGNLAFEVAKAMESRGRHVSDLIMVDAMRKVSKDESTPEQLEEIVETVLDSIADQYKEFLAEPSDRKQVKDKMLVYSSYRNELINAGKIQGNIHALIAEGTSIGPVESDILLWQEATHGQYAGYEVIGTHDVLLDSGYIGKNAQVLRQILRTITEASHQNKPVLS